MGSRENQFLYIIGHFEVSAYSLHSFLKKTNNPISYKNVHKTLKKLHKLNLIETVPGKFKRNAKYYRIRPTGLFQILLNWPITVSFLIKNKNDPILKIILYQFFELSSIKYFDTVAREYFISEYINQCAKRIVEAIEEGIKFNKEMKASANFFYLANLVAKKEIKSLIYDIVTMNKVSRFRTSTYSKVETVISDFVINKDGDFPNYPHKDYTNVAREERSADPNYQKLFPHLVLNKDKKFMSVFDKMKKEFETGCNDFV